MIFVSNVGNITIRFLNFEKCCQVILRDCFSYVITYTLWCEDIGFKYIFKYKCSACILLGWNEISPVIFSCVSFTLAFCTPFSSVTSGLRCPSPLPCTGSHADLFAVNATLNGKSMAEPCVNRLFNGEDEAGQPARTVFQVLGMARSGIKTILPALVVRIQRNILVQERTTFLHCRPNYVLFMNCGRQWWFPGICICFRCFCSSSSQGTDLGQFGNVTFRRWWLQTFYTKKVWFWNTATVRLQGPSVILWTVLDVQQLPTLSKWTSSISDILAGICAIVNVRCVIEICNVWLSTSRGM